MNSHGGQRHGAKAIASVFSVMERDQAVLNALDPAVGYGDLEHVGGEVADCVAVFPDRLVADVPGWFPCLGRDGCIQTRFLHFILEPGFEQGREGTDRDEEVRTGSMPGVVFGWRRRRLGQCNGYGGDRQAACPRYEARRRARMSPPANRSFAASVLIEEDEALNMAS